MEATLMNTERTQLSVEQVVGVLRRRAAWILLCFLIVAATAYGASKQETKKYTATASLVFNNNQPSQQIAGLPVVSGNNEQALENTNVKLVQLGDMAARTASELDHGLTKGKVESDLAVGAQGESNIVNVSATSTSPVFAAAIANTYSTVFVSEQQNSYHGYYSSALAVIRKQLDALSPQQKAGPAGLALQDRAQALAVLAELQSGTVRVAQAATVPTSSSSPRITRNTVLGALVGLLLGLGVAFLLERLDRRIKEPTDLEAIFGRPLLGVVPASVALARAGQPRARRKGGRPEILPAKEAEAFQLIRAHLRYFNVDRELRTLLVTSAAPAEGKTTIALDLAAATARMGSTVLLLEADFRHPTLAARLGIGSGPGLADVLVGSTSLRSATQSIALDQPHGSGQSGGLSGQGMVLDVLLAGTPLPPNPGELIESDAMEAMLQQAGSTYDLIVIDTPPLIAVSDSFPLLGKVDGVIVVSWVGRSRRDVAERVHQTLVGTGAPLLGVIANGYRAPRGAYGYGYPPYEQPAPGLGAPSADGASASGGSGPTTGAAAGPQDGRAPGWQERLRVTRGRKLSSDDSG
jgi:capsular exopolysaccharide synthesis family protein